MVVDFAAQRLAAYVTENLMSEGATAAQIAKDKAVAANKIASDKLVAMNAITTNKATTLANLGIAKSAALAEATLAATTGAAVAAAWASAAAMVSLATMGGNAAPATAGIASTVAFSQSMAIPMLADGGIATGATLAIIGEGKNKEAVLPLNRNILAPIFGEALDYAGNGGEATVATVNIYGDVGSEEVTEEVQEALLWALRDRRGG